MSQSFPPILRTLATALTLTSVGALTGACSAQSTNEVVGDNTTSGSTTGLSNTTAPTTQSATVNTASTAGGPTTTSGTTGGVTTQGPFGGIGSTTTGASAAASTTGAGPGPTSSVTGAGGASTSATTAGSATTGSDLPTNPSGLPEPGAGGVAQPAGTAGNLEVLPWAGYKGAISYSFDDANSTQINNEAQLLGLGVHFTWFLQTGKQEAGNAFYQRALDAGHELANHTQSHGSGAADSDITQAQSFLMSTYQVVGFTMAAPNGSTNNYNSISGALFILDRGVNDGLVGPDDNTNMLNFPSWIPPQGAGTAQFNPKADAAQSQGKWQTVCIHGFTGGSDGAYQPIDLNGFVSHVEYVKEKGDVWIGSFLEVGAYFLGRKAVAAAAPQTQGTDQVYSWTLPTVFPPGQYVRVKVDGGTVSQDGVTLPWNEHGFYEVALDVGSVTLSP